MKPTPIRRKGCKNVGWIYVERLCMCGEKHQEKVIVPLHPGKPFRWISKMIDLSVPQWDMLNVHIDPLTGSLVRVGKEGRV